MTLAPTLSPQRITFRAVRAIEEGTEISMTYVDVCLPRSERRQQLYHNYLFDCTCSMCTENSAQATANRIAIAANAGDMLGDASSVALERVEQVERHSNFRALLLDYYKSTNTDAEAGGAGDAQARARTCERERCAQARHCVRRWAAALPGCAAAARARGEAR